MWRMKAFVFLILLVFGLSISSGRWIEDASRQEESRDEAEATEDDRDMEDEGEEEGTDSEEEREDSDEQENRDAREEVVHIPGQSEEPVREEADDTEEDNQNGDFDEEEEEVDNLQDDRMMDGDEGGMSLAGQTELEDKGDQTGFEGFKRKVDEINKANEDMQAEINKLKLEFDEALSSDSNNDEGVPDMSVESKPAVQRDTSSSYSNVNKRSEDTAENLESAGVQHRTDDGLVRWFSEMGEDANIAPDDDY